MRRCAREGVAWPRIDHGACHDGLPLPSLGACLLRDPPPYIHGRITREGALAAHAEFMAHMESLPDARLP